MKHASNLLLSTDPYKNMRQADHCRPTPISQLVPDPPWHHHMMIILFARSPSFTWNVISLLCIILQRLFPLFISFRWHFQFPHHTHFPISLSLLSSMSYNHLHSLFPSPVSLSISFRFRLYFRTSPCLHFYSEYIFTQIHVSIHLAIHVPRFMFALSFVTCSRTLHFPTDTTAPPAW